MFSHVMVGTSDLERSIEFYNALFAAIGGSEPMRNTSPSGTERVFYMFNGAMFGIAEPIDRGPATFANGGTIGFACNSAEQVKAFHDAGVAAGGISIEDPPGRRDMDGLPPMDLCYLRDPDGNKLCGLHMIE